MQARKKILIVDADEKTWVDIDTALTPTGYAPIFASSVKAAMESIKKDPPVLVMIDEELFREADYDFVKQMDQDFELGDIPILVLSSNPVPREANKAITKGALSVVSKPIDKQVLHEEVKHAVESPRKWPEELLLQIKFAYSQDDEISGRMLRLASSVSAAKPMILGVAALYFVGALAMLLLHQSVGGFIACCLLGTSFLLCPNLVMLPLYHPKVAAWLARGGKPIAETPYRMRFFATHGIRVDHVLNSATIPWDGIKGFIIGSKSILILIDGGVVCIPRRVFAQEEQEDEMLRIVKKHSVPYAKAAPHGAITWIADGSA